MTTTHFTPIADDAPVIAPTFNNPLGELDATINGHTHNPAKPNDGGQVDHNSLANRGQRSHGEIDNHLGSTSNPHATTLAQVAALGGSIGQAQVAADTAEAATDDPITGTATLVSQLNRLRFRLERVAGTTFAKAGQLVRSLANHQHDPRIEGDGGMVVQEGVAYDATKSRSRDLPERPSIKDNLSEVRADIYDLQQGISIGTGVITSKHIADKGLAGDDLADRSVGSAQLGLGVVLTEHLNPCRPSARSAVGVKSLVIDIAGGVYYLGSQKAIVVGPQSFSFEGTLPTADEGSRMDTLYMNSAGQVIRIPGDPSTTGNPQPKQAPDGTLPICQIYLRGVADGVEAGIYPALGAPGITPTDSYIYRDIRPFLNLGGGGGAGGGTGGDYIPYAPVVDGAPVTAPNGSQLSFLLPSQYLANSTAVTVAEAGADPVVYTRVASAPGAHQYTEHLNKDRIVFGVAPGSGATIRVSYFRADVAPQANMVWSELPTGAIDGANRIFATASPFITGSLLVFRADSLADTLEHYIPGIHYTEDTGLQGFVFGTGYAPPAGSILRVQYARADFSTANADTVGGYPARGAKAPNVLLALNAQSQLPADVTGTAAALANPGNPAAPFAPSQTPAAGQVPVVKGDGTTQLPGALDLPSAGVRAARSVLDTTGANPAFGAVPGAGNTTIAQILAGTGGFRVRRADNGADLLAVDNAGSFTFLAGIALDNGQPLVLTKPAGGSGNNASLREHTDGRVRLVGGLAGVAIRDNADAADNFVVADNGNATVRGTLTAGNTTVGTLGATTLTTSGAASVGGNLSVAGTLSAQLASGSVAGLLSTGHWTLLNGATSAPNGDTLVKRSPEGYINATYFNATADEPGQAQPYKIFGRTAGDSFLRTFNPDWLTSGAAKGLARGYADGNKLDRMNESYGVDGNGWATSYLPNGKRVFQRSVYAGFPGVPDALFTGGAIGTPAGLPLINNVLISATLIAQNAGQINVSLRGAGNSRGDGQTSFQIHVSTLNATTNLNQISPDGYVMLIAHEV